MFLGSYLFSTHKSHSIWINFRKYYYACPDDKTFKFLASVYSRSHHNMSTSEEFQGGITNGASWYGSVKCKSLNSYAVEMIFMQKLSGFSSSALTNARKKLNGSGLFCRPTHMYIFSATSGTRYMVACKIGIIYMVAALN